MTQRERWVLCAADPFEVDPLHIASLVVEDIHEMRWWSAAEMRSAGLFTAPRNLPSLLDRITAGNLPDPDADLGI